MKARLLAVALLLISCIPAISQDTDDIKGFTDCRFYYNLSFISVEPLTIPYGAGLSTSFIINKRLSADFGLTVKPSKKEVRDISYNGDWGAYGGHVHDELSSFVMDMPIHLNYQLIKIKAFRIFGSVGSGLFYIKNIYDITTTVYNQDAYHRTFKNNNLNLGFNLGIIESLKLSKKIGIFASQYYGKALLGYSTGFKSTDFNFGLTYNFK